MKNDVYGEPETFVTDNAVVTVRSPILTPDEYERRMERIKQASVRIVLAQLRAKEMKRKNEQQDTR